MTATVAAVAAMGVVALLDAAGGDGSGPRRLPLFPFILAAVLFWCLRVAGELYEEWRVQAVRQDGGDGPTAAAGWWDRAAAYQQAAAEAENETGGTEPLSPATNRVFELWAAYLGVGFVVSGAIAVLT